MIWGLFFCCGLCRNRKSQTIGLGIRSAEHSFIGTCQRWWQLIFYFEITPTGIGSTFVANRVFKHLAYVVFCKQVVGDDMAKLVFNSNKVKVVRLN